MVAKVYYATWPGSTRTKSRGKVLSANMERDETEAHTYYFTPDLDEILSKLDDKEDEIKF